MRECSLIKKSGLWGPIVAVRVSTGLITSVLVAARDIRALEIVGEQTKMVTRGTSHATGALAGGLILGPAGLLAGSLVSGKSKFREGTGKFGAVLRTRSGLSYPIDCTLKQAQAISAAIVDRSVLAEAVEVKHTALTEGESRAAQSIAAHFEQAAIRMANHQAPSDTNLLATPPRKRKPDKVIWVWGIVAFGLVALALNSVNPRSQETTQRPDRPTLAPQSTVVGPPALRLAEDLPAANAQATPKVVASAVAQPTAHKLSVSDQCAIKYVGSTSGDALMQANLWVRKEYYDCIGYYYDHHHRYPTAQQLTAYTAAQDRDYERHLSRNDRRLRDEYAIGEAVCGGDETCVQRGVDANQAIDKVEDQMDAGDGN